MATLIQSGISGSLTPNPCINAVPALDLILTQANARVANHIEHADNVEGLHPSLMVIQTELGYLVYTKGDLSFLVGKRKPVTDRQFYKQIKPELKYQYDGRQSAVWERRLVDGEQFQVAPNWNAAILPFLAKEERFTVTVFIPRASKQRN